MDRSAPHENVGKKKNKLSNLSKNARMVELVARSKKVKYYLKNQSYPPGLTWNQQRTVLNHAKQHTINLLTLWDQASIIGKLQLPSSPTSIMTAASSKYDGFSIHMLTTAKINTFVEHCEEHMKWLEEVLIEAKRSFASPDIELLPKTPAVKRRRQKRKAAEESQTDSDVEKINNGSRAKRNKRISAAISSKRESAQPLKKIQLDSTTTSTDETDSAASIETAQPTVPVSQGTSEDNRPKRKRAPPRARSKRATRRTTRSMSAENIITLSTDDSSVDERDQSACSDGGVRPRKKRGRPKKKEPTEELDSRNKAGANKYVDHVKRLINKHEQLIQENSSGDEFQSPKRQKCDNKVPEQKDSSVLVPDTPEKKIEECGSPKKFFPPVTLEQINKPASSETNKETVQNEISVGSSGEPTSSAKSDHTDTDDYDDSDHASASTVDAPQANNDQSPEKVAPIVLKEKAESPPKEQVAEQLAAVMEDPLQKSSGDDMAQTAADDNLSTISTGSTRASVRHSNRPSAFTSKSKRRSSVMSARRSSVRKSVRTVMRKQQQRASRANTRLSHHLSVAPLVMEALNGCSGEDEEHMDEMPKQGTQMSLAMETRRLTRNQMKLRSVSGEGLPNKCAKLSTSPASSEQFEDSLEQETRPPRESSRLKKQKSTGSRKDSVSSVDTSLSPECPPEEVVRPHPSSFLNNLQKKQQQSHTPTSLQSNRVITSFIKRNTPQKSLQEKQQAMKMQIQQKRKRDEEIRKKVEMDKRNKIEEQKRKREERVRKVAEARQMRLQWQQQKRHEIEARNEKKQVLSAQRDEEKRREELQKRRQMSRKKVELEERRRQEEDVRLRKLKGQEDESKRQEELLLRKREFEETERQRRIEEARRQQEERRLQAERLRHEMDHKKLETDLARERDLQQLKSEKDREKKEFDRKRFFEAEERERAIKAREEAEEERQQAAEKVLRERHAQQEQQQQQEIIQREKDKVEQDRLKANILKHNTSLMNSNTNSALNTTVTKEPAHSPQSYQITPQRSHKKSTDEDYGIDDLGSDDSSDDEDAPRKNVPSWAQGSVLKAALINQYLKPPPNFDQIFPPILEAPDLTLIFAKKKAKFLKRTSSAHWNSPIWKPGKF